MPASRLAYWKAKFAKNKDRDRTIRRKLRRSGWRVLVVWECQTRDLAALETRLRAFLDY